MICSVSRFFFWAEELKRANQKGPRCHPFCGGGLLKKMNSNTKNKKCIHACGCCDNGNGVNCENKRQGKDVLLKRKPMKMEMIAK
jgi:hypothetical protein